MSDLSIDLRRAVLPALKDSAAVTAVVARDEIYPQTVPAKHGWPFIRYGASTAIPITATCVTGEDIALTIHGFAKPRYQSKAMVETAEDHAGRIAAAIKAALHHKRIVAAGGLKIRLVMTAKQIIQDAEEADAYHALLQFRGKVLAA